MNEAMEAYLPEEIVRPLLSASKSSSVKEALEFLIETSRSYDGRSELASKSILPAVLRLTQELRERPQPQLLLLCLKLLRNLCAEEIANQDLFIKQDGVNIISEIMQTLAISSVPDYGTIRMGLQVLANVSSAGEKHKCSIWVRFFPDEFLSLARIRSRETIVPLCGIIYACSNGNDSAMADLCGNDGLLLVSEIVRTVSAVDSVETWFELLLTRICLQGPHLASLFSKLHSSPASSDIRDVKDDGFSLDQAFLLRVVLDILNERFYGISVSADLALSALEIYKRSLELVDFHPRGKSSLPTGLANIDVLEFSLTILRDACAQDGHGDSEEDRQTAATALLSCGLLDLQLGILRDLEPLTMVRKAVNHVENGERRSPGGSKVCPYKGFRSDLVTVIGNCSSGRKHVQDEIREKGGIPLLLQHCVMDEENPFLREWGILAARNFLLGNDKNQQEVPI